MTETPEPSSDAFHHSWEFPGWGKSSIIKDLPATESQNITYLDQTPKHKLGTWKSTAICGNDITSSVLYVSALCTAQAGVYAPIVLLIVSAVLYLYRKVYAEVGSALPLNGGTYTVLLNTTNKKLASGAACLTLLSYIATAVISANEAMHYAHSLVSNLNIITATIGVLAFFALLNLIGITESAVVALGIFIIHMLTMTVLAIAGIYAVCQDFSLFQLNWNIPSSSGLSHALIFGFAAAMLGISGFESSANFIEEQQKGVFPKTLKNMWLAVAILNPLISLLALGLLPLDQIQKVPPNLLATMGDLSLGSTFAKIISIDAVLVLSGAVLTSYVGVTGLVRRMTLDRCLPQILLQENSWRKTNHWIILGFFGLCTSILLVTSGNITTLAGVYTLSFLSVMGLFAIGNMLLKRKRSRLPRDVRASWTTVTIALVAVIIGFAGNVLLDPVNVQIFAGYFLLAVGVITVMFLRVEILKLVLFISRAILEKVEAFNERIHVRIMSKISDINSRSVVYFTKGDNEATLNQAALYVLENEETNNLKVVHVFEDEQKIPPNLAHHLQIIDKLYPHLRIDFLAVKGTFDASLIDQLAKRLNIPKNMMFIGTPGDRFPYRVEQLGGVRVILA
ncbi:MAG: APC family permease [Geobacteraceae bacterium]|nr:APC family permease [Geobacteraceae bacterium]